MGIIIKFLSSEKPNSNANNLSVVRLRDTAYYKGKKSKKRLDTNKARHINN